jgi:CHAT domain-containing protein
MSNRGIRKALLFLMGVLYNIIVGIGQPIQLVTRSINTQLDTAKLNRILIQGDRTTAGKYLAGYLNSQPDRNGKDFGPVWLEKAIFLAWNQDFSDINENLKESREAFSQYRSASAGLTETPLMKANRLLCQSLFLSDQKLYNQAADSLIASITTRPSTGTLNRILLADSYGKLARLYKKTGDLFESSRNFERSIELNRQLQRTRTLAEDFSDLSSVLSKINIQDRRADSVLQQSLDIYNRIDSLEAKAQVLNELGVLANYRGNVRASLEYLKQSLAVKSKIPGLNKQDFIIVINNIGACYQDLDITDSARLFFSRAVDYAILSGVSPAPYYANLGANYGGKDQYSKALEYFQKALNSLDPMCSATDLSANPRISRVTPRLAEFTAFKAHSFHRRYNQLKDPNDLVNGLNTFMVALEMIDTLRFMYSFNSKPLLSSDTKIHFFNALDIALDLYNLTGKKEYLNAAFQLSERNKSATLNEFLRTNQARAYMGNIAPWIKREDSIKQVINKIESDIIRISSEKGKPQDSVAIKQNQVSSLTDELKNIGINARQENPDYFKMVYSNHGYQVESIQKLINPGEALVDYTVVNDRRLKQDYMAIMVLTRDTLFTFRDTLPGQFRTDIAAFRATITTPFVDTRIFQEFTRLSYQMYRYFFEPIEKFRGIDKVILLPDEDLGFLPFESFVSDTIKPKGSDFRRLSYLNRKYQITYISSHEQFYQFRSNPGRKAKSTIYAFAPFVSKGVRIDSTDLLPLENTGMEARSIARYFKTKIYTNKEAGEETLRRAFQQEAVITLSTHGIMNLSQPMQSRLLLNPSEPDGSLYLFEMLAIKIKSPLVVLNACNTGMGKLQPGEGILSIARGFQFAGVPTVITTLWPIDDQSSATVIKFFFQNLHDGMSQGEALMKARNNYIDQSEKATGAPYFWAGEVLIGDPGPLVIQNRINPIIPVSASLFVIILIGLLIFYKKSR